MRDLRYQEYITTAMLQDNCHDGIDNDCNGVIDLEDIAVGGGCESLLRASYAHYCSSLPVCSNQALYLLVLPCCCLQCGLVPVIYPTSQFAYSGPPALPNAANAAFLALLFSGRCSHQHATKNRRQWQSTPPYTQHTAVQ